MRFLFFFCPPYLKFNLLRGSCFESKKSCHKIIQFVTVLSMTAPQFQEHYLLHETESCTLHTERRAESQGKAREQQRMVGRECQGLCSFRVFAHFLSKGTVAFAPNFPGLHWSQHNQRTRLQKQKQESQPCRFTLVSFKVGSEKRRERVGAGTEHRSAAAGRQKAWADLCSLKDEA